MHPRYRRAIGIWAISFIALSGCGQTPGGPAKGAADATASAPSGPVTLVKPERRSIHLTVRQPGSVQAFEHTPVHAKIAGYVRKWKVDIGDHVGKGDVLAELYVPELMEELKQKEASVVQAKEALEVAAAKTVTAAAAIKEAQAGVLRAEKNQQFWQLQYDRLAKLTTVLEAQTKDEAWNQLQSATAATKETEAKVETAQATLKETEALKNKARADIGVAEAERDRMAALVGYTRLTAPFAGVVTRRNINTDDFVQPPTAGKGEPLYIVERRDLMRVQVEVPEAEAAWVNKKANAVVRVQALQGREFTGSVARTSYAVDRATRTLVAEIDLANTDDELRPGMYLVASIMGEQRNALSLPVSAILTQGDVTQGYRSYCFVALDDKAVLMQVEVGLRGNDFVEVRRRRTGAGPWEEFSGAEQIVADARTVTEGQNVSGN
jgi:multidrug efflux pump subunit AcrA (membrane-fusion protein)